MKLSSFPFLIQKEILDHLSINKLFFFSLCSKNTKNFIKETQKHQLEKVERVIYSIRSSRPRIYVKMAYEEYDSEIMQFYSSDNCFHQFLIVQEVQVNEFGIPIDFVRCLNWGSNLDVKYCPDTLESTIKSIHNHLYDLLGNHTKFWMENLDYDIGKATCFVPLFQNIQKIDFFGNGFESAKIDEFLDGSTCLEHFSWDTSSKQPIQLRENSKLYDLDTVYLASYGFCAFPMANDVLKRFNGRHVFFNAGDITTPDVIQFLNEWKSGEKFKNLELISMEWNFEIQEIHNSVEIKEVVREVKYSFVKRFEEHNTKFHYLDSGEFKSHYYMVRESDGHVASVMLTEELIFMGVWNMTEKEFLIKFHEPIGDVPLLFSAEITVERERGTEIAIVEIFPRFLISIYSEQLALVVQEEAIPDDLAAGARKSDKIIRKEFSGDGFGYTFFCYLLMDPRILGQDIGSVTFERFVRSIFYVGKGTGNRPLDHFKQARKERRENPSIIEGCEKLKTIDDLWLKGYAIPKHEIAHGTSNEEALAREACIIEAITLANLKNQKSGEFHGSTKSCKSGEKAELGILLLEQALATLKLEGIRAIREEHLPHR